MTVFPEPPLLDLEHCEAGVHSVLIHRRFGHPIKPAIRFEWWWRCPVCLAWVRPASPEVAALASDKERLSRAANS